MAVVVAVSLPAAWLIHTLSVLPYAGQAGDGSTLYDAEVLIPCLVEEKTRRIRASSSDTSTGDEVLSEATAYADLTAAAVAACQPDSKVTLPSGKVTRVLQTLRRDGGNLPVPSHLEIVLA